MRGLVSGPCNEVEKSSEETVPTLTYRLNEREKRLTRELQDIQKAKEILAKNPEFLELLDSVQRIGMY